VEFDTGRDNVGDNRLDFVPLGFQGGEALS
jgi:hypothetical protein